jgi:6-phosphogluconolactonase
MRSAGLASIICAVMLFSACGSSGHHFVYAVGESSEGIFAFSEDGSGALKPISGSPFSTGGIPRAVTVTPSRAFLYVLSDGGDAVVGYTVDATKGTLVRANPSAPVGNTPVAIVINSACQHVYVLNQGSSSISGFSIDPSSGNLTALAGSPYPTLMNPVSMAISPKDSALYVVSPSQGIASVPINSDGSLGATQAALAAGASPSFVA